MEPTLPSEQKHDHEDSVFPKEPQPSTSRACHHAPSSRSHVSSEEDDLNLDARTSSNIISIIDMVWTSLEVVLVLLCILPNDRISWKIAALCLIPNVIQFAGAVLMYKKTEEVQEPLTLFRSCQLWLFLAFLTLCLQAAFVTWTAVTGIITTFLVFILVLKFLWRFTAMFFVNELHNELELIILSASHNSHNNNSRRQEQLHHHHYRKLSSSSSLVEPPPYSSLSVPERNNHHNLDEDDSH